MKILISALAGVVAAIFVFVAVGLFAARNVGAGLLAAYVSLLCGLGIVSILSSRHRLLCARIIAASVLALFSGYVVVPTMLMTDAASEETSLYAIVVFVLLVAPCLQFAATGKPFWSYLRKKLPIATDNSGLRPSCLSSNVRRMKSAIYKEDEFGSRRTFELQGSKLRVETHVFRRSAIFDIDLTDCVPDYTTRKGMLGAAFKRAITYLTIVLGLAFVVHDFLPAHGAWIAVIALIIAYPGFNVALRSLRPVEVLEFRDSKGKLLFDFLRPRRQVPQINLDEFIAKIRSELIQPRQPNKLPEPMSGLAPGHGSS